MKQWDRLLETFYLFSNFDPKLQEEVRRNVAYQVGCAYCMSHGCPAEIIEDPKTQAAVSFARKLSQTNLPIAKEDIEALRKHFSDPEIAELAAFISFGTGYARFGSSLGVDVSLSEVKK